MAKQSVMSKLSIVIGKVSKYACRHYVPAVSYAIYLQNKIAGAYHFNLKGLVRGNTAPAKL